jgi:hypothetical protein
MSTSEIIARQYHSALKMLEQAIQLCPEPFWLAASAGSPNRTWHIAFHALFYTHFYLSPSEAHFEAWPSHRLGYQFLGAIPSKPDEPHVVDEPYSQIELLQYAQFCHREIDTQTAALDLAAPSGFYWLPFDKLELQFYNIRHLAHHTGQISERLRAQANLGLPWVR